MKAQVLAGLALAIGATAGAQQSTGVGGLKTPRVIE